MLHGNYILSVTLINLLQALAVHTCTGMSNEGRHTFLAIASISVVKHIASAWIASARQKSLNLVGEVSRLVMYPLKSGKGMQLVSAECTSSGLRYKGVTDRHWVLTTQNGIYIDQLMVPRLALVETTVQDDVIFFNAPDMKTLKMTKDPVVDLVQVHKIGTGFLTIHALDCGDEAAAWFERFTGREGVRLYFSAPHMEKRKASDVKRAWTHAGKPQDTIAFAYLCGYMMVNTNSVDALKSRLGSDASYLNFRPNIVMKGTKEFQEDEFDEVQIGDASFRVLDKVTRCRLINVDQETGVPGKEPFETLLRFRIFPKYGPGRPCMGIYLGLDKAATVHVGDKIYAR